MTRYSKHVARLSVIAAAVLAVPAFAATDVSANAEFDTGIQKIKNGSDNGTIQGGRIETNISGKATNGDYFVAGKGTLILGAAGGASADDAWVQFGTSAVDVKLARFEAADLWPTPGDVYRMSALYSLNTLRGRSTYGSDGRFHAAITANVAPGTSVEVGIVDKKNVDAAGSAKGIRPSVAFAAGPVSARVGFESGKVGTGTNAISFTGFGGWVNFAAAEGISLRANLSTGSISTPVDKTKLTAILLGVDAMGANFSFETGKTKQGSNSIKSSDIFAAYTLPLFGVKGATIAPAVGWQTVKVNSGSSADATKVGFRVHYDF